MDQPINLIVPEKTAGIRLDKALVSLCEDLSRSRLKNLILEGCVEIDDIVMQDPSYKVKLGQEIALTIPEVKESIPQPQSIPLDIVYEDKDIIVVNKPAGMVVHPAPGSYDGTLVNALLAHCGNELSGIGGVKRPGIVHRLDKDTSGLLVVAKNDQAHHGLSKQFADRTISRHYYALVWGVPKPTQGTIEGNIGRHHHHRQKMAILKHGGKPARTHYKVIKTFNALACLVECKLESGRTHQIRVHMTEKGHSIIGDAIYGRLPKGIAPDLITGITNLASNPTRHALHAYLLQFIHPITDQKLKFTTQLPTDLQAIMNLITHK